MRRLRLVILPCLILPLLLHAQTADDVIALHVKALGGLQKLKALQTMRVVQRIDDGKSDDYRFVIFRKRGSVQSPGNKFRMESEDKGIITVSGCDGQISWMKSGNQPSRKISSEAYCGRAADIDELLVDYRRKGFKVVLAGKEETEGRAVFHLMLTGPKNDGKGTHLYIDAKSYLLIKISSEGAEHHEDILSDYRPVNGVMFPFVDEMRWWPVAGKDTAQDGATGKGHQKQIVEKLAFNLPLKDEFFKMPLSDLSKIPEKSARSRDKR